MNKKILKLNLILILCIAGGCLLRVIDLNIRSLEYDEIWTLQHYFKYGFAEIFTNLETPNNHPLHTWLAKTLCSFAGYENWVLRLSAFLSGIALMAAAWLAAGKFFRSKYAKIALMALIAFSPYLVHYSNTARGYSMQAFFVFVLIFLLFSCAGTPSWGKAFGIFFTAAAALFTVYSGLIFICAAGGAYLCSFFNWKDWKDELKKNLFLFAAGADFCIVAALWLGFNWEKITKAQQFGTEITSVMQFLQSSGHLIYDLGLSLPLVFIVVALILRPKDKIARFGLVFVILTFLSMLVTKCGPERVYVPMIAVVLFCAARGIEIIGARLRKYRYIELGSTIALCLPLIFMQSDIERISPPDWRYFVTQIEKNTPDDCYVIYPAGDTYPIFVNYGESALNLAKRSQNELTMAGFISPQKGVISALAEDSSEKTLNPGKMLSFYPLSNNYGMSVYPVVPLSAQSWRKNPSLLVFFVFMPKEQYLAIRRMLFEKDECYLLNAFFNRDLTDSSKGQVHRAIPFFIPAASQSYSYYAKLAQAGGGRLKFYVVAE